MEEAEFLDTYDASAFQRPSLAVDLVLMSVVEGELAALLMRREQHPHRGRWALPGGFVGMTESLDAAARRVLADKARLDGAYVEQLYTFGEPGRDPRTRIISVAYFALLPAARFAQTPDLTLARLEVPWAGEAGGAVAAHGADGATLPLAFDHGEMLGLAVKRLRGRLDYSPIAFNLLPERFTLLELQRVHEAIAGRPLNKPAFRRRLTDTGWIEPTGERAAGTSYRPPELYRFRDPHREEA